MSKLITTALLLAVAAINMAAQNPIAINAGTTRVYRIDQQPEIVAYNWAVYTNENLNSPAMPSDVVLTALGAGRENEVQVTWNTTGTFYLTITVTGTDGCDNIMAFPFEVGAASAPVLLADINSTIENMQVNESDGSGNLLANDYSPEGYDLFISAFNGNSAGVVAGMYGNLNWNADGTYFYNPNAELDTLAWNDVVTEIFTYTANDGFGGTASTTLTITIYGENDAPVAANDQVIVPINSTGFPVDVLWNDFDIDGDLLSVELASLPVSGGSLTLIDNVVYYNPPAGFTGSDNFAYQICDNGEPVLCASATVNITVTDQIIANNDVVEMNTGETININPLQNDVYAGNINIEITNGAQNGTWQLLPDGTISYQPDENFSGTDSIVYLISNEYGSDNATIIITVKPVVVLLTNVYCDGEIPYYSWEVEAKGITINSINLSVYDSDGALVEYVENASVNGSRPWPEYELTATNESFSTFGLLQTINITTAFDVENHVEMLEATLTKPYCYINTVVAVYDTATVFGREINIDVLANDYDPDEGQLNPASVSIVNSLNQILQGPFHGEVSVNTNGTISYVPNPGYAGIDSFTYRVCDNQVLPACDTAIVRLTLLAADELVANTDRYTLYMNQTGFFNVVANDFSPKNGINLASLVIIDDPENGNAISNTDGTLTYVPLPNFEGIDSFMYRICDSGIPQACDSAWVLVNVRANICIVAQNDTASTPVNEPVNIALLNNDFDFEGTIDSTFTIVVEPTNGTLRIEHDHSITYTPDHLFAGLDSFIYRVSDLGYPPCADNAVVYITVIDNNQPIVALPDLAQLTVNQTLQIDVLANDYDPDGEIDTASLTLVTLPSNGEISIINGALLYVPNADFIGTDTLIYRICDNGPIVSCDTAQVVISVNEKQNLPPLALNDTLTAWSLLDNIFNIVSNDTDPEGELNASSLTIIAQALKGDLLVDTLTGLINYIPWHCAYGADSMTYVVYDAQGLASNVATVYFFIEIHPLTDSDGDGIADIVEDLNRNGNPCDDDTNGNGTPNYMDLDDDGDCMLTADEIEKYGWDFDLDGDGIPNYLDPDDNGDGIPSCEQMLDLDENGVMDRDEIWNAKAVADAITVGIDENPLIPVLANDSSQIDPSTLKIITNPSNGYVSVDETNWMVAYFPDIEFVGRDSFVYMVCDYYGLCDTASVLIYIEDIIYPPQLFTPNGDGVNDYYVITGLERYPENNLVVFNRWGNKVYEYNSYYNQWDGKSNVKAVVGSRQLPVGVYYYRLKYGKDKEKAGALFLER